MKVRILIAAVLILIAILTGPSLGPAGDLNPPGPPTSGTMKPLDHVEPRGTIGIVTTPGNDNATYRITQPGSYYLTGNITSNYKHAIEIDADDVTLDLMGFRLWSSYRVIMGGNTDFDGIHILPGRRNIEIRNGTIASERSGDTIQTMRRGFRHGIYAPEDTTPDPDLKCYQLRIIGVRVMNSRGSGVYLEGMAQLVKDCSAVNNTETGIFCTRSSNSRLTGNITSENGVYGLSAGSNCVVTDNVANSNGVTGIWAQTNCVVDRNVAVWNGNKDMVAGGAVGLNYSQK
jgi:parallel beta-helix repeat protein